MPVHIENMTSEVTVLDGDFPLNEAQLDKLIKLILQRLAEQEKERNYTREATTVRHQAISSFQIGR